MKLLAPTVLLLAAALPCRAAPPQPAAPEPVDLKTFAAFHEHVWRAGVDAEIPNGEVGRCIRHQRGGPERTLLLTACSRIDRLVEEGPVARAVLHLSFGGQWLVHETSKARRDGGRSEDRYTFQVDENAMLTAAIRFVSELKADGTTLKETVTILDVNDPKTRAVWKTCAEPALKALPTYPM